MTFATFTTIWESRKAYTTAKNAAFAELEEKIIFIIVTTAAAAWEKLLKAIISVRTNEPTMTAQYAWATCTVQESRLYSCVAATLCIQPATLFSLEPI